MNLLDVGLSVLKKVKQSAASAQAEVFLVDSESRSSDWSEGKPENQVIAQSRGLGLRLVQEGRLGFGFTNRWETDDVTALIRQAIAASDSTTADPMLDVPEPVTVQEKNGLEMVDGSLSKTPWESRAQFLESLDPLVKKRQPRISKVLRGSYREGRARVAVVNSRGVAASYEGTSTSFSLVCVAAEAGETQIGYAFQGARF